MRDTKWRYLYLRNPIQLQTWLEDLSLEGWRLEKVRGELGQVPPHSAPPHPLPAGAKERDPGYVR